MEDESKTDQLSAAVCSNAVTAETTLVGRLVLGSSGAASVASSEKILGKTHHFQVPTVAGEHPPPPRSPTRPHPGPDR